MLSHLECDIDLQVKELRDIGDDMARVILHHQQDGSEPPKSLRKDFENFLSLVGCFIIEFIYIIYNI